MPGKITIEPSKRLAPSLGSFLDGGEGAEVVQIAVQVDPRHVTVLVGMHAFDAGCVVSPKPGIDVVLASGREPQIADAVIQSVPVNVINVACGGISAVYQQPREPMGQPVFAVEADNPINPLMCLRGQSGSSNLPDVAAVPNSPSPQVGEVASWPFPPSENASVGIVVETLADEPDIGQPRYSHCDLLTGAWSGALLAHHSPQRPAIVAQRYG